MKKYFVAICLALFFVFTAEADPRDGLFESTSDDIVYGNKGAPIEVLEYYSLTCHHCSYFYLSIFPNLKKEYIDTGKVRWIKRSYALDPVALKATLLLGCVDVFKKENYLKILLSKQANWAYQQDYLTVLGNIAGLGGMSMSDFKACVNNLQKETEITNACLNAREKLKISGTPTIFVNKEQLEAYSEVSFKEAFDKVLKK